MVVICLVLAAASNASDDHVWPHIQRNSTIGLLRCCVCGETAVLGAVGRGVRRAQHLAFSRRCVSQPRTLRCPMCRTEVNSLMENFRAEEWEADRRDERNTVLARANTFNRRFSGGMGVRPTFLDLRDGLCQVGSVKLRPIPLPCLFVMQWRERAADVMMGLGRLLTHPPAIADLLSSWSSLRVLLGVRSAALASCAVAPLNSLRGLVPPFLMPLTCLP